MCYQQRDIPSLMSVIFAFACCLTHSGRLPQVDDYPTFEDISHSQLNGIGEPIMEELQSQPFDGNGILLPCGRPANLLYHAWADEAGRWSWCVFGQLLELECYRLVFDHPSSSPQISQMESALDALLTKCKRCGPTPNHQKKLAMLSRNCGYTAMGSYNRSLKTALLNETYHNTIYNLSYSLVLL